MQFLRIVKPEDRTLEKWIQECSDHSIAFLTYSFDRECAYLEIYAIAPGHFWAMHTWSYALDYLGYREVG